MSLEKLKIYFCHRGIEKPLVSQVLGILKSTNCLDAFFDETDLKPGMDIPEKLRDEIEDSDYFLFFLSKDMLLSDWVRLELDIALRKQSSISREFIVPVLLPDVDSSKLPDKLNKVHCLELHTLNQDHINLCGEQIIKTILFLVGTHFRKKSKNQELQKEGIKSATRQLANLDFSSLESFYHSCKVAHSGTFYNVQISSDEWFAPNVQIHLAVQEGMAQHIRWRSRLPKNIISDRHMPFKRISFLANTRNQLIDNFEHAKDSAKNLCALMHIHNLMACPLAIVTVDDLAEIIINEYEFFSANIVEHVIGIPREIVMHANPLDLHEGWKGKLKDKLLNCVIDQANDGIGTVEPSMDFAIFKYNKSNITNKSLWAAKVANDGALVYYNIPNAKSSKNSNTDEDIQHFPPVIDGIEFKILAKSQDVYNCLLKFSEIMEKYVFWKDDDEDADIFTEKEIKQLKAYFEINPLFKAIDVENVKSYSKITKVRKKYCPWKLLYDLIEPHIDQPNNSKPRIISSSVN